MLSINNQSNHQILFLKRYSNTPIKIHPISFKGNSGDSLELTTLRSEEFSQEKIVEKSLTSLAKRSNLYPGEDNSQPLRVIIEIPKRILLDTKDPKDQINIFKIITGLLPFIRSEGIQTTIVEEILRPFALRQKDPKMIKLVLEKFKELNDHDLCETPLDLIRTTMEDIGLYNYGTGRTVFKKLRGLNWSCQGDHELNTPFCKNFEETKERFRKNSEDFHRALRILEAKRVKNPEKTNITSIPIEIKKIIIEFINPYFTSHNIEQMLNWRVILANRHLQEAKKHIKGLSTLTGQNPQELLALLKKMNKTLPKK